LFGAVRFALVKALFIQQDHVSPVGPVGERFEQRGFEVVEFLVVPQSSYDTPGVAVDFPDPLGFDAIVPMGAPWSVYDDDTIPWVGDELAMLRAAHDAGVPVLGICFGGQALAAALGGAVQRAATAELGWYEISTDAPGLVERGPWFQWHSDRWTRPPGSVGLARTENAEQAYTIGRSLGVQFHPELTADMLAGWLANGGARHLVEAGVDAAELIARTKGEEPDAVGRAHRLVDRFLAQVASR
jgi:GMP synthase-like glutamine amidotransferase